MSIAWRFPKDPADIAPYTVDWRGIILADDEIDTATWDPSPGTLTVGDFHNANRLTTAILSGGVTDTDYEITITVTTVNGYTFKRVVTLRVEDGI